MEKNKFGYPLSRGILNDFLQTWHRHDGPTDRRADTPVYRDAMRYDFMNGYETDLQTDLQMDLWTFETLDGHTP